MSSPTPDNPLRFIVRDKAPSLKNGRLVYPVIKGRKVTAVNRPNQEVSKFIKATKAAFSRQLPKGFEIIKVPEQIGVFVILRSYCLTSIPDQDTSNMEQTVEEALQGVVIEDDRQISALNAIRLPTGNKDNIYHEVYVWRMDADLKVCASRMVEGIKHIYGG